MQYKVLKRSCTQHPTGLDMNYVMNIKVGYSDNLNESASIDTIDSGVHSIYGAGLFLLSLVVLNVCIEGISGPLPLSVNYGLWAATVI